MKHVVIFFLVSLSIGANAQDSKELDRRNGFKSIKLGNPVDSVKGYTFKKELKEKDEFPVKLYEVEHEEYKKVGEVAVQRIQLLTYQDLIYKIIVTTDKDPRVMKALERSFGKSVYVVRTYSYNWKGENLSLTFLADKNSIDLIYRSYPLILKMKADKSKKIDLIAEDF